MIYAFLAEGFEETEAIATIDVLRRADIAVTTVGIGGTAITGAHGITVTADMAEGDIDLDAMSGIFLPGGMPGTTNLDNSATVQAAVTHCAERGLTIAAICAAPSIIGKRGLLRGRRATCFDGFEGLLEGALYSPTPCAVDGNFITGRGAGAVFEFALAIVAHIKGQDAADRLKEALKCP